MPSTIIYSDKSAKQLNKLDKTTRLQAISAIEKLLLDPELGKPLVYCLKGYRRARAGKFRIIYSIEAGSILIAKIGHRKNIYD